MKNYIVIGAGRFGQSLATTLLESNQEVMVIDENEDTIQSLSEKFENVAIVNATDESALRGIGIGNFDVAIIAIGSNLRSSIMATVLAKEFKVPLVISKAQDKLQADVLRKIGADRVVFPERDMGIKLAKSLMFKNVVDYMELDNTHSIFEITVPKKWIGKNLLNLKVRNKYNINVTGMKRDHSFIIPIDPKEIFLENDILIIAGKTHDIESVITLED